MSRPTEWALGVADEIVISEGLAPSSERDLVEKIARAIDEANAPKAGLMRASAEAERVAVVVFLRACARQRDDRESPQGAFIRLAILDAAADRIAAREHLGGSS